MNKRDFASYADDNIPYVTANNTGGINKSLEKGTAKLFQWFTYKKVKS